MSSFLEGETSSGTEADQKKERKCYGELQVTVLLFFYRLKSEVSKQQCLYFLTFRLILSVFGIMLCLIYFPARKDSQQADGSDLVRAACQPQGWLCNIF